MEVKYVYRVYCLAGKDVEDIFYVGVTKLPLIDKLKFHINNNDGSNEEKCKKIEKYADVLQIFELEEIGLVTKKKALERELHWMVTMKKHGYDLLNKHAITRYVDPCRVGKLKLQNK